MKDQLIDKSAQVPKNNWRQGFNQKINDDRYKMYLLDPRL